jgi:hypothetical protein
MKFLELLIQLLGGGCGALDLMGGICKVKVNTSVLYCTYFINENMA